MMKKFRRRLFKTFIFGAVALLLLLVTGFIYQQVSTRQDQKTFIPPGKLYSIHDENMHLYTGGQGNATVVLASPLILM
ncbi:hypothetical protein [Paenibacillus taichungensis]|uniref:hypothetical protein n=1 Tax=Paenibacillus taichungensis TaxID=484184 RepID=UPI003D9A7695